VEAGARFDWRWSAPRLAVLAVAAHLIFFDLGGPWLWEDEGDTAAFARNIVATGLPTAWDGRTFLDGDYGMRVVPRLFGHDLVMVGTPWLPFYATAASFALFGESNAAARLPSQSPASRRSRCSTCSSRVRRGHARGARGGDPARRPDAVRYARSAQLRFQHLLHASAFVSRLGERRRDPCW
jgi:hypothetical protein